MWEKSEPLLHYGLLTLACKPEFVEAHVRCAAKFDAAE
jgi:hypothetical protein